ncbi:MAG TPA: hypothetical protein VF798_16535 [Burkholderiaceae bacterium]
MILQRTDWRHRAALAGLAGIALCACAAVPAHAGEPVLLTVDHAVLADAAE